MSASFQQSGTSQKPTEVLQPCDLVLKGGITSGIVYPPAILQLKDRHRFCNIGGTSAGAIAAAGIAAAEFHRNKHGDNAGFTYLDKHVQQWLTTDSNLRNLFQASPAIKPLMDFALALLSTPSDTTTPAAPQKSNLLKSVFKVLKAWFFNYLPISFAAFWGAIIGLALAAALPLTIFALVYLVSPISAVQSTGGFTIAAIILGLLGAWPGWHIGRVISAIGKLPENGYGICTGHTIRTDGTPDFTNLTDWLSKAFDEMAGPAHTIPLTFEDLNSQKITLKMVTSNLSQGLPYVMPEGLYNFLFKKSDMLKLFPQHVVQHMIDHQPEKPLVPREKLPELPGDDRYYYLPAAGQLPVIVCTRMSLSFPILLSAIPLYTISTQAYHDFRDGTLAKLEEGHLQLNWFSDGGLCSNFPIQFFDAWLPRWPTFGINLTSLSSASATSALHEEQEGDKPVESAAVAARNKSNEPVYLPQAEDRQDPEWDNINGLPGFVQAIFGTAQNYRDTMQAHLPSYRERIVQIRLNKDEGGLNLAMPRAIIEKVIQKGSEAGVILRDEFKLNHHVWVRFL
ncbi:MAG: patatin-like phospholipase family protein, partial [Ktedonobacteraceae bacterium]|nr:patatin-like phospholipase family protein [Ktedonobacteraceae bacterium]